MLEQRGRESAVPARAVCGQLPLARRMHDQRARRTLERAESTAADMEAMPVEAMPVAEMPVAAYPEAMPPVEPLAYEAIGGLPEVNLRLRTD